MTPEEQREYELSCSEAVNNYDSWSAGEFTRAVIRLRKLVADQDCTINALRDSLEEQTDLIEALESERDNYRTQIFKLRAEYDTLKTNYVVLENANGRLHRILDEIHEISE